MMDAARVRGMRFILMKQETAGAMLASTWGEITGAPGVCLSTRGPGAANMVNGVAHAWMDRCPLIVITDQYPPHTYETGLRQRMNHLALYTSITKWNSTIGAKTVRQQIRRGMRIATAHPPGPVQFDMPSTETTKEAATLVAEPSLRQSARFCSWAWVFCGQKRPKSLWPWPNVSALPFLRRPSVRV
jgi:acetolactate synthase-1/2/3 large subunit